MANYILTNISPDSITVFGVELASYRSLCSFDYVTETEFSESIKTGELRNLLLQNKITIARNTIGFLKRENVDISASYIEGTVTCTVSPDSVPNRFDFYQEQMTILGPVNSFFSKTVEETVSTVDSTPHTYTVYYSDDTLTMTNTPVYPRNTRVCKIMVNGKIVGIFDERFESNTDWFSPNSSDYKIDKITGLKLTANLGDGSSDTDCEISLTSGTFQYKGLQLETVETQTLDPIANLPIYYREDSISPIKNNWTASTPDNFPIVRSRGSIKFNYFDGTQWSLSSVSDGNYAAVWVVATNEINYPIAGILGQHEYTSLADAKLNARYERLILEDEIIKSFKPLYRLIFRTSSRYSNTLRSTVVDTEDLRSSTTAIPLELDNSASIVSVDISNVLFVDVNGNDTTAERGNMTKPFQTIQAAFNSAQSGDVVKVGPGTFLLGTEEYFEWPDVAELSLIGSGRSATVLQGDAGGGNFLLLISSGTTPITKCLISDLTLFDSGSSAFALGIVSVDSAILNNVRCETGAQTGIEFDYISSLHVSNCHIDNWFCHGVLEGNVNGTVIDEGIRVRWTVEVDSAYYGSTDTYAGALTISGCTMDGIIIEGIPTVTASGCRLGTAAISLEDGGEYVNAVLKLTNCTFDDITIGAAADNLVPIINLDGSTLQTLSVTRSSGSNTITVTARAAAISSTISIGMGCTLDMKTPGGTGQYTYAKGDLLYASDADILSKLSVGTENQILSVGPSDTLSWIAAPSGSLPSGTTDDLVTYDGYSWVTTSLVKIGGDSSSVPLTGQKFMFTDDGGIAIPMVNKTGAPSVKGDVLELVEGVEIINQIQPQLSDLKLNGANMWNTDLGIVYLTVTVDTDVYIDGYSDAAKTSIVFSGFNAENYGGYDVVLNEVDFSGISGTVDIAESALSDSDAYAIFGGEGTLQNVTLFGTITQTGDQTYPNIAGVMYSENVPDGYDVWVVVAGKAYIDIAGSGGAVKGGYICATGGSPGKATCLIKNSSDANNYYRTSGMGRSLERVASGLVLTQLDLRGFYPLPMM